MGKRGRRRNRAIRLRKLSSPTSTLFQAAVTKTDKAAFVSLVLPEGTWTTKHGFTPMNLLADGLLGFDVTKWEMINPHVTRLSEDSAVVIYVWSRSATT